MVVWVCKLIFAVFNFFGSAYVSFWEYECIMRSPHADFFFHGVFFLKNIIAAKITVSRFFRMSDGVDGFGGGIIIRWFGNSNSWFVVINFLSHSRLIYSVTNLKPEFSCKINLIIIRKLVHNNAHEVNQQTTPATAPFTSYLLSKSFTYSHINKSTFQRIRYNIRVFAWLMQKSCNA